MGAIEEGGRGYRTTIHDNIRHLGRLYAQGRGVCALELVPRQGDAV